MFFPFASYSGIPSASLLIVPNSENLNMTTVHPVFFLCSVVTLWTMLLVRTSLLVSFIQEATLTRPSEAHVQALEQ